MTRLLALTRRELGSLLLSPALYIVLCLLTIGYGFLFHHSIESEEVVRFEVIAQVIGFLLIFFVSVLTMRSFAGETNTGTIEILLTAPVRPIEVVLSKFFGSLIFYIISLLPCIGYIAILAYAGDVDSGVVISCLFGLVLLGCTYVAVGIFISSLTNNLIVSALATINVLWFLLILSNPIENGASPYSLPAAFSFWTHFKMTSAKGLIDTRSLLLMLTIPGLFIFLTWLVVASRGMLSRVKGTVRRRWQFAAGAFVLAGYNVVIFLGFLPLGISFTSGMKVIWEIWDEKGAAALTGSLWPFVLSVCCLAAALFCHRVSQIPATAGKRVLLEPGRIRDRWLTRAWPTLLSAIAVVLILINVNYFGLQYYKRWDITEHSINTLSPDTCSTLDQCEDNVEIVVFLTDEINYQDVPLLQETRDLLSEFSSYSAKVKVRYLDAMKNNIEATDTAKRLKLNTDRLAYKSVISYQGRTLVLPAELLMREPDWKQQAAHIKTPTYQGELAFTSGIKRLLDPRAMRVYFTTGHGEMDIHNDVQEPHAAGKLAHALMMKAFEVSPLALSLNKPIPDDCDVLVMMKPTVPLGRDVCAMLLQYANRGGRLMILLPSATESGIKPDKDLLELMSIWGAVPRHDLLTDRQNNMNGVRTNILAYSGQPGDKGDPNAERTMLCMLPKARSFRIMTAKENEKSDWQFRHLLTTFLTAEREPVIQEPGARRERGQVTVAYAALRPGTEEHGESRVAILGNAEFVSNMFLDKKHNQLFIVNLTQWLAGRDYQVDINKREYADRGAKLSTKEINSVWLIVMFGIPQVWLILTVLVWWIRKQ